MKSFEVSYKVSTSYGCFNTAFTAARFESCEVEAADIEEAVKKAQEHIKKTYGKCEFGITVVQEL